MTGIRGRDREWARATTALARVTTHHTTLLVIEGPPGIGKTRFLTELVEHARARGLAAMQHQGSMPALTLSRVIAESQRTARDVATAIAFAPIPIVAPLVAPRLPTVGGPVLIAWDDPPWSNSQLLATLHRTTTAVPMVWALTRPAGVSPPGLFGGADVVCVELAPLTDEAVAQLVADQVRAVPSAQLQALCAVAAGNPGRVNDLLDGLQEENLLAVVRGEARLMAERLPHRVAARIRRQLGDRTPEARKLLQLAALLGVSCRPGTLAHLMRKSAAELLPIVEEVLATGLLACGPHRLSFRHELVRAEVADSVPPALRPGLQEEIARIHPVPSDVDSPHRTPVPVPPRPGNRRGWRGLTDTELRVARLARNAMTNQQIAHEMAITIHTVNFHLRHIFKKLQINSRVQLAFHEDFPDLP
jgi:DNA-binding CsgD family transcriptional regulator